MTLGDLVLQNFFGIVASVIASVLGYVAVRILRGIRASTNRTEEHAKETAEKVSQLDLDKVSLTAHNRQLEQWQQDMALRIEAAADYTSDSLAWQATFDRTLTTTIRRVAALEQFAIGLAAYARGDATLPSYTAPVHTTDLVGAPDGE